MTYRHYSIFYSDPAAMTKAGFGQVATVPFIFDEDWKYNRASSRYLRDRARGLIDTSFTWAHAGIGNADLAGQGGEYRSARRSVRPTEQSLEQIGRRHVNFLEWCQWHVSRQRKKAGVKDGDNKPAWHDITYDDLLELYQKQMQAGTWGSHGLAPSTVNSRVDEACFFLHWAHLCGYRGSFGVDTKVYREARGDNRSDSHKSQSTVTRSGRVRARTINLRMPKEAEVDRWLAAVSIEKGPTKALMCRLMRATGIRREECVQWRMLTLPEERGQWSVSENGQYVTVTIEYGAKGKKIGQCAQRHRRPRAANLHSDGSCLGVGSLPKSPTLQGAQEICACRQ